MQDERQEKISSIEALHKEISFCRACDLHLKRTQPVPGSGSPDAKIMFVGEAPGKDEDIRGLPFVGAAGKFLSELLTIIDLKREDVFIANVLKCRPPDNRDPQEEETKKCWPFLERQFDIINPQLIVLLGRHAMYRFLPESFKISLCHGRAFEKEGKVYFPVYHPAMALYKRENREVLIKDFLKIPALLKTVSAPSREKSLI